MGERAHRFATLAATAAPMLAALLVPACSWPEYDTTDYDASLSPDVSPDSTDGAVDSATYDGLAFDADAGGDGSSSETPADACVPPLSTSTCVTCVATNCASQTSACSADANCTKRRDCAIKCCGSLASPCVSACGTANPSTAGDALQTCLELKCLSACFGP